MLVKEIDLPGIGRKFVMETKAKGKMIVIVHDNGTRELYIPDPADPDERLSVGSFTDDESRKLAGIIGGMAYKPKALENLDIEIDDLVIEWHRIDPDSEWIGKTIGELKVRQTTGVSIIAVVEKEKKNIVPGPDFRFVGDSVLVIAGERQHIKLFKELLAIKA
ncbi:cation:proton antiporter regulatory subunit [Seleniivibrio woodruffii]|uniref:Potassium/proton antiporter regulatory subunit (CPA2 family) n=1 Tax=Seleniivibrio woodruffii TaxID=1078050 RepID=A0A4R1K6Y6_9BACT|nr:cation:proton antiporter regulatory subunit [Seleniivibrio woodruffii]TCK59974.1 potassium/proton antiporter regulatory subunit (CPA2 family) [Seleniivibrio woodruffii]TVZ35805.1 TrkA domain protein [Seleniivibrio woodruffii]